jgi:flagellar hook protein FlgE
MMRSLYSGVSGLKNHQTRMDVIANNISNVNTIGYKASRTVFADIYSQTVKTASGATISGGGINAAQIGLGVKLAAIDILHTSAATSRTDNTLDLAIEGDGFFVIQSGDSKYYTRAGNFYLDNDGNLVTSGGDYVLGLTGEWDGRVEADPDATPPVVGVQGTWKPPAAPTGGSFNATDLDKINLDGFESISIDEYGVVRGLVDGENVIVGYVAIATFQNNAGLEKVGNSYFAASPNSGAARFSMPTSNAAGQINPGGLEMSNVDLSSEFTDMIITQRGFQANSRVITTSDTMLEELINLKR